MAVDTRDKRSSVVGITLPVPQVVPNPDASIDAADRQHVAWAYSGIAAAAPAPPASGAGIIIRRRRR